MPTSRVQLRWKGQGLRFRGGGLGRPQTDIDGDSEEAISPVDALVLSIAGCMGSDVVHILEKSRVDLTGLVIDAEAPRAEENPRRLVGLRMTFRLEGPTAEDRVKVERAIELSRTTYCSVLHSLDPGIEATFAIEMV